MVCNAAGKLSFDDYDGRWGNVADAETLRAEYAITAAELAAASVGWISERTADGLRVFHPVGRVVGRGEIGARLTRWDSVALVATEARATLADFIGREAEAELKPEYNHRNRL